MTVDQLALGLFALVCPVMSRPADLWERLPERQRDLYRAKARFVMSMAVD